MACARGDRTNQVITNWLSAFLSVLSASAGLFAFWRLSFPDRPSFAVRFLLCTEQRPSVYPVLPVLAVSLFPMRFPRNQTAIQLRCHPQSLVATEYAPEARRKTADKPAAVRRTTTVLGKFQLLRFQCLIHHPFDGSVIYVVSSRMRHKTTS